MNELQLLKIERVEACVLHGFNSCECVSMWKICIAYSKLNVGCQHVQQLEQTTSSTTTTTKISNNKKKYEEDDNKTNDELTKRKEMYGLVKRFVTIVLCAFNIFSMSFERMWKNLMSKSTSTKYMPQINSSDIRFGTMSKI